MLTACNNNTTFFNAYLTGIVVTRPAKLPLISRQLQEFILARIFKLAAKHELKIETANIVSDYNIRIFTLDYIRPC